MYEQHEKKYSAQLWRKGNFSLSNAAKGSQNVIPNFQKKTLPKIVIILPFKLKSQYFAIQIFSQ